MSGFAGIAASACSPHDWSWLLRATAYMEFRGPDGKDVWRDERVALGYAFLRTVDDQTARSQPFSLDGQVWITGDVRLDGREELIRRLRSEFDGISRRTDDTELLLHAYELWGEACLDHISGDFAFAIWDRRCRLLFCARDHFGVAQFYYALAGSRFVFSNTAECLLLHAGVSDDLNDTAIGDCVMFQMNLDAATTAFAAIQRLPPAHALTWADGVVKVQRYWDVPEWDGFVRHETEEEYVEQFRALFTQAVSDRLRTNRISVQLSGGLDSTSVAATAHRLLATGGKPFDLRAHTVVVDGLMPDEEGRYAGMVADALRIPSECLAAADYPNQDPSQSPDLVTPEPTPYRWTGLEYDLGRRAARHGRVALSGHGGDAALMYIPSYWIEWLARGELNRLFAAACQHVRLFRRLPKLYLRPALRHLGRRLGATFPTPDWLDEDFVRRIDLKSRSRRLLRDAGQQIDTSGMARSPFWSNVFAWADPGFTRLPLKYRHPFFDLRLVKYLLTLPPAPWFVRKMLLRDAMRNVLPPAVGSRRKTPLPRDMAQALAEQRGLDIRLLSFVASVPGLERYFVRERFEAQLQTLATAKVFTRRPLVASLGLAHWMYHWHRPGSFADRGALERKHEWESRPAIS